MEYRIIHTYFDDDGSEESVVDEDSAHGRSHELVEQPGAVQTALRLVLPAALRCHAVLLLRLPTPDHRHVSSYITW